MKAVLWTAYGPPEVLRLGQVAKPAPRPDQILVRVAAANAFAGDCELRRFEIRFPWSLPVRLFCGLRKPRHKLILGQEFAGEVVEVGASVTRFKPGDRVFGANMFGPYAEFIATTGAATVVMPHGLTCAEACVVPTGGLNALHFLRVARLHEPGPPRSVLLNGAGGSIGTIAIQLAKLFGAEVTAVDSGDKLAAQRALGADHVIDYTREDPAAHGRTYDAVIDIAGKSPFSSILKLVKPGGWLVLGNPPFAHLLLRLCRGPFSGRKVRFALAGYRLEDLEYLRSLLADGRLKPLVDRVYPLDDVVEAHRYVESGRRVGNVVLAVSGADDPGLSR